MGKRCRQCFPPTITQEFPMPADTANYPITSNSPSVKNEPSLGDQSPRRLLPLQNTASPPSATLAALSCSAYCYLCRRLLQHHPPTSVNTARRERAHHPTAPYPSTTTGLNGDECSNERQT
ncbi:hypothetical protein K440DRAFT_610666 [Wilcoxina mikolae CBS 423.85]|nr:hypothetical protein K440DRAFT_610666 [Wilcoxina mikolae CBS 423.85]